MPNNVDEEKLRRSDSFVAPGATKAFLPHLRRRKYPGNGHANAGGRSKKQIPPAPPDSDRDEGGVCAVVLHNVQDGCKEAIITGL